jgi:hypothetical protein
VYSRLTPFTGVTFLKNIMNDETVMHDFKDLMRNLIMCKLMITKHEQVWVMFIGMMSLFLAGGFEGD